MGMAYSLREVYPIPVWNWYSFQQLFSCSTCPLVICKEVLFAVVSCHSCAGPLVVGLRLVSGIGWQMVTFPILIGAFFGGQFLGGLFKRIIANRKCAPFEASGVINSSNRRRSFPFISCKTQRVALFRWPIIQLEIVDKDKDIGWIHKDYLWIQ